MKKWILRLSCLLLFFTLCSPLFILSEGRAEWIAAEWKAVKKTLDCDGYIVNIDAVTNIAIPTECNEWTVEAYLYSEDEVRRLLAVGSPGDETLKKQKLPSGNRAVALFNDERKIHAGSELGNLSFAHYEDSKSYSRARVKAYSTGYYFRCHEQEQLSVPILARFDYQTALSRIEPVFRHLNYVVGEPSYVEAWNVETLMEKSKEWLEQFPDHLVKLDWTEDDELYYLEIPVYYQGIRLHRGDRDVCRGLRVCDAGICCEISPERILVFRATDCFFQNEKARSAPQPILPLDEAIERYGQHLSSMIWDSTEPIVVDKILLEWLVLTDTTRKSHSYQMIPVWCFYYKEYYKEDYIKFRGFWYHTDYIHAITGEYIPHTFGQGE